MSATVLLTRNSSFETLVSHMPASGLSCRAAAAAAGVMRALPLAVPAAAPAPTAVLPCHASCPPVAPVTPCEAPDQPAAPSLSLPAPPAGLPSITTQPTAESEAQALADQLEDLLLFTSPHAAPEDPQLLVHSPPAEALRAAGAVEGTAATAGAPAESAFACASMEEDGGAVEGDSTPHAPGSPPPLDTLMVAAAGDTAGPEKQPGGTLPAVHLSPASKLAIVEGPSLADMLRGPRPLRDIALREVTRSPGFYPQLAPAFSGDLDPAALGLLEPVVAPAQQAQHAQRAGHAAVSAPVAVPAPPVAAVAAVIPAPAAALLKALPAGPGSDGVLPLSPTCAPGVLSPSKSSGGGMIQLAKLHKGEWHKAQRAAQYYSDYSDDGGSSSEHGSDSDDSSDDESNTSSRAHGAVSCPTTREGSIESPRRRRVGFCAEPAVVEAPCGVPLGTQGGSALPAACAAASGPTAMQLEGSEDGEEGDGGFVYPLPRDAIMTGEGVRRVLGVASSLSLMTLPGAVDSLADEPLAAVEECMDVTIQPSVAIPGPLSQPAFASLSTTHAAAGAPLGPGAVADNTASSLLGAEPCLEGLVTPFAPSCGTAAGMPVPPPPLPLHCHPPVASGPSNHLLSSLAAPPPSLLGVGSLPLPALGLAPAPAPPASPAFARFLELLRCSSTEFEAEGRVLRLRRYLRADVPPYVLDAVLQALAVNTRVEALYIQNFEHGMGDVQLDRLIDVLKLRRIWAVNVGENFAVSQEAWERFCSSLPGTAVGYLFVSEQHLRGTDLKARMREAIRENRRAGPERDPQVVVHVGNMWWNPRLSGAPATGSTAADNSSRDGSNLPSVAVAGSKRGSTELDEGVSSSPLLRRAATGHRIGFRGSLVAGASRATLLRPQPPPLREPPTLLALNLAGSGAGAGAAPAPVVVMTTRARAGAPMGSPTAAAAAGAAAAGTGVALEGAAGAVVEAEAVYDDGDEDYRVEDDAPLTDDDLVDELDFFGNSRLRRRGAASAAAARVSRRLQERTGHHYSPRHTAPASVPLSDQFLAISGTAPAARSGMPPAKRQRAAAAAGSLRGGYETISGLAVPAAHGVHATAQPSAAPTPRQTAAARKARSGAGARRAGPTAQRLQRADSKGKPSFAELVESGFMRPGQYQFTVGTQEVAAVIEDDGAIRYAGSRFRAISKFALVVLRERNPSRQSCDGWKEVAWNGEKLDVLRLRLQQFVRQQARRGGSAAA
ncbi:hypothetical protein N2152v2_006398 [Parachlorella kessleri]